MASQKILLVLGAGSNIGQSLTERFKSAGYSIALVSRSAPTSSGASDEVLRIQADLTNPGAIASIFETVKAKLGAHPTVVVYNAAALTVPSDMSNIFTVPVEDFERDMAVMNTSAYVAAREAVAGFEASTNDAPKAFIYTGNIFGAVTRPVPRVVTLGAGKSAAGFWLGVAGATFKEKGYKFHFADERHADGGSVTMQELSGPGAAEFYLDLAEKDAEIPWYATFVAGKGYVHFPETSRV
ncbi:hypothetical protein S40288_08962 [Stachybotrys chartarum IBT 40288]|nr:hypothetical protein S40288_08962 [Stachybotrys chartarum IBT 40288]